ncbi:protein kinase [Streptomyces sp. NPDC087212]|uniref:serine/threonine-protein kinase n=1 Tax=Streptomyces sp. NPDC087212 TaxID=3365766 RepID=UPI0037F260A9
MDQLGAGDASRIGGYRLLARLGAGGMGRVYLARNDRGRTVAVKLVRPELAAQEEFRARFRQEVRAARQVGGDWTAPVLDADTEAPVPWVATGYVPGPSLQQVVGHDHGPLPEHSVRVLAAGLARALQDIHAAGIVHRDLKPSNVLVTLDGPRVIDFGLARALETVADSGLTRTGALVGSPGFMAPEQVRGDRITPACDIFCLGSVLVYAATGRLPFGTVSSGVHAVMFRIAQEEPDLTGVPDGLADLIHACLDKDPATRPPLDTVLDLAGADDTQPLHAPWLPTPLIAQLGRHAIDLLATETPPTQEQQQEQEQEQQQGQKGQQEQERRQEPGEPGTPGEGATSGEADIPEGAEASAGARASEGREFSAGGEAAAEGEGGGARGPGETPATNEVPPEHGPADAHPAYGSPQQHPQQSQHPLTSANGSNHPAEYSKPRDPLTPATPTNGHGDTPEQPRDPLTPATPANGHGYTPQQPQHPLTPAPAPAPAPAPVNGFSYPPEQPQDPLTPANTFGYGYGYPHGFGPPGTPGTAPPYDSPYTGPTPLGAPPDPPRRDGRSTAALLAVALVVVVGAGGSVYALLNGGGGTAGGRPTASTSTHAPAGSGGAVPSGYLGTWRTTLTNAFGKSTRTLTLKQGKVGDAVLSLVAEGPGNGGAYRCVFKAVLTQRPQARRPLTIGPSTVTSGTKGACSPGDPTYLQLLPDGALERVNPATGESLTYTRR